MLNEFKGTSLISVQLSERRHCTLEWVHSGLEKAEGSSGGWVLTGGRLGAVVLEQVGVEGWGQLLEGRRDGMSWEVHSVRRWREGLKTWLWD